MDAGTVDKWREDAMIDLWEREESDCRERFSD